MIQVTDPTILSQLNGSPQIPVTDPALLNQLNSESQGGFVDNVGNDWKERLNNSAGILSKGLTSKQTIPETYLQLTGQGAGALGDVIGESIKSLTPQSYIDTAHSVSKSLDNTAPGQLLGDALMKGRDAVSNIEESSPRLASNLSAMGNILSMTSAGKGVSSIEGTGSKLGLGDAIYNSGKTSQDTAHAAYIKDLILPKQTPSVKADMALRTKQIDGANIYQPTLAEQQMAATVGEIPGISKINSLQKNLGLIQDANSKEAEALKNTLKENDVVIPDDTVIAAIQNIRNTLPQNTTISAPGEATIERVVNSGTDHITKNPNTASGMLEARKAFDNQMIREKGEGVFDPAIETPRSNAIAAVRQAMNEMVANAVPSAEVLASLRKQSNLFQAADNIAPKAGNEAKTRLGRALQTITPHSLSDVAGGAGLIGAASAAYHYLPPSALGAALTGYGLYKGVTAPSLRTGVGRALGVSK